MQRLGLVFEDGWVVKEGYLANELADITARPSAPPDYEAVLADVIRVQQGYPGVSRTLQKDILKLWRDTQKVLRIEQPLTVVDEEEGASHDA